LRVPHQPYRASSGGNPLLLAGVNSVFGRERDDAQKSHVSSANLSVLIKPSKVF